MLDDAKTLATCGSLGAVVKTEARWRRYRALLERVDLGRCRRAVRELGPREQGKEIIARLRERLYGRQGRQAVSFLLSSLMLGSTAVFVTAYTPAYALQLDGQPIGTVYHAEAVEDARLQVEAQVSALLGTPYDLQLDLEYDYSLAARSELLQRGELVQVFYEAVPELKPAFVLRVDGEELFAMASGDSVEAVLETIRLSFESEQTTELYFANDIQIVRKYIPQDEAATEPAEALAALGYVSAPGEVAMQSVSHSAADAAEGSAERSGEMSSASESLLTVVRQEEISVERVIPSPVQRVADANLYIGEEKTLVTGQDGTESVRMEITSKNGRLLYEEELYSTVQVAATETVVAYGTKERPADYGTGSFRWPTEGRITSPYGYRYIFGSTSFHQGLDIANSSGTALVAADTGRVTKAGYQGSYGNLIVIDHNNGYETYYAHCSSLAVSVGDVVEKGDYIGAMGSTGRSTGSHLHFEVRINGETRDPIGYLP